MKQHITQEQWWEISREQQDILIKRFSEEDTRHVGTGNCPVCGVNLGLSIGQMIEFLRKEECAGRYDMQLIMRKILQPETFCDSLWEAVKYKLNNQ